MTHFNLADFQAVAFDLEGTLADTIPTHQRTRLEAFRRHGYGHISAAQHALGSTYGSSHTDILGGVLHAGGVIDQTVPFHENQTVLDVIATKGALFKAAADEGFEPMPEAVSFVRALAPRFAGRMAVVTSSEEEFVYPFLDRSSLAGYFAPQLVIGHETIVCEGLQVKPHGDPFALAMRRMDARKMLAFEDTVSGVASAKKAGATVIALSFEPECSKLFVSATLQYPPDVVVSSYSQAAEICNLKI